MTNPLGGEWIWWAIGVVIGLPIGLVLLTEVYHKLARRGSSLARPVGLIRNYLLPLGALLALMVRASEMPVEATPVRMVATLAGFVLLLLVLSGFNITMFETAPEGSWRRRMPAIFLEVARFVVIAVGVGMILSYVWGANVGGLFTALGVTSIVLGLTLQNSVGQIVSGLFVLFEQPFQLGDWIETPTARGRVVEVNWRATHIRTGDGLQVMPNSVLAATSFVNLSRPSDSHVLAVDTDFAVTDPPDQVIQMLSQVARMLPQCRPGAVPRSRTIGPTTSRPSIPLATYRTSIPLKSPVDDDAARANLLRWVWYAARRAGLHLDAIVEDDYATPERLEHALNVMAPALRLTADEKQKLLPHIGISRYGADEVMHLAGRVPERMVCVVSGRVELTVDANEGAQLPVCTLNEGELLGQTALTREPVRTTARALTETVVVHMERSHLEKLVYRKPMLLHELSRSIDQNREDVQRALATASN